MAGISGHRQKLTRIVAILAAMASLAGFAPDDAQASQQACRQLEARLASAGRSSGQTRRYDKAIRAQALQLEKTRIQAGNAGCTSIFSGLRPQCNSLGSTISRMEGNLVSLRQQRAALSGGDPGRERARIMAALNANGCRGTRTASARELPRLRDRGSDQSALFDQLFGGKGRQRQRPVPSGEPEGTIPGNGLRGSAAASGNYRTLCVRTCDGYYFPIAYSSSPARFDTDAKSCEAACPGTDVELYHHRVPSEESEQMVSASSGRPYTELPAAFLYRQADYKRPAACGCNPPKDFSIIAGGRYEPEPAAEAAALPGSDQADQAEPTAPNGTADAATGDDASVIAELPQKPEQMTSSVENKDPAERRVRVVGPTFLPDPEEAIDLQAPGQREVR